MQIKLEDAAIGHCVRIAVGTPPNRLHNVAALSEQIFPLKYMAAVMKTSSL